MPPLPMVNVEIDGQVVARPRVIRVLACSEKGAVTCTQPQLWPGERLLERSGAIPVIVKESDMLDESYQRDRYRDEMVRAVLGTAPAILAKTANPVVLNCLAHQLADAETAKELLRANGHGRHTDSLTDMVRTLLNGRASQAA
jgi:hypothetical protein